MHFILKGLICKRNTSCHYQTFKMNKPIIEWKLMVPSKNEEVMRNKHHNWVVKDCCSTLGSPKPDFFWTGTSYPN